MAIKSSTIILFLSFLILSLSCRKYAEGPYIDIGSTKKLIQGTWEINSFFLNDRNYKYSLDSLYGEGGKLLITEIVKKEDYQIELIWNNCSLQKLKPCRINSIGNNVSIAEKRPKTLDLHEILCDYSGDYVEIGYCFNLVYHYLLLPKIFEIKYASGGNYGGSIEILKLNKKELKLAWKRSRPPYEKEIVVMELSRE